MTIEKDDRNLRPGLCVNNRTTAIALCRAHEHTPYFVMRPKSALSVLPSPAEVYLSVPA
jgi:hypothetical protein